MSVFDSMKHAVHTVFKETVEAVTPVSNVSQFRDKGVLTPEEFVAAGHALTGSSFRTLSKSAAMLELKGCLRQGTCWSSSVLRGPGKQAIPPK
eukprot:3263642-Rhodomonas_salina.1